MTAMVKGDWSSMSDATVAGLRARPLTLSGHRHARGAPRGHGRVRSAERAAYRPTAVPAPSLVATVSQRLVVEAVPELAPGSGSTTTATAKSGSTTVRSAARVGTPGTVPSISFPTKTTSSIKVTWGKPSDGGRRLTGFGLLFWRTSDPDPAYSSALVKGASPREHTYTGLQANTTYKFRIHACNGPDSCGWWTHPPKEVSTPPEPPPPTATATATAAPVGRPDAPHSLSHTRTATSFTVTWGADPNSGGASLTGFGILQWEKSDSRPPDSEATNLGAGVRSKTFSGLKYGRSQGFEIRACNGSNRCSAWASRTVPAMAGLLPTIALPKTTIEIGERIKVGANDVPVGAVAYLQLEGPIQPRGRCSSSSARTRAVPRAPSPSTGPGYYDSAWIDGCAPGGDAVIRLESQDGSVLYDRRMLQVVRDTPPPGEMHITTLTADTSSFTVNWAPPQNTDGETITGYDVLWRQSGSEWDESTAVGKAATARSHTVTGRDANTIYVVKVRACRGPNGDAPCWAWSADGRVTTLEVHSIVDPPPSLSYPVSPECPLTSNALIANAVPQNIDVTPQSQRRATLCWSPVQDARDYVIEATHNVSNIHRTPHSSWHSVATVAANKSIEGVLEPQSQFQLRLDRIVTIAGSTLGLANHSAFGIRIKTIKNSGTHSPFSTPVIVIDTPITEANGDSRGTGGKAKITWVPVSGILNNNYANGQYELRHRASSGDHTTTTWTPEQFEPPPTANFRVAANPHTIRNLVHQRLYAVQLIYRDDGRNSHDTDVFAARNVYVWPSVGPPDDGERVATFPLTARQGSNRLLYRICGDSFGPAGDPRRADWEAMINGAFQQWSNAIHNLVTFGRVLLPCATDVGSGVNYNTITQEIKSRLRMGVDRTDDEIGGNVREYVDQLRSALVIERLFSENRQLSEVLMYDDISLGRLATVGAFFNIATDIGYWRNCWYGKDERGVYVYSPANMCTAPSGDTRDIVVRRGAYDARPAGPVSAYFKEFVKRTTDDQLELPAPNSRFNKCLNSSDDYGSAFQAIIHEVGHVIGVSGATDGNSYQRGHPSVADSVVNYDKTVLPSIDPMDAMDQREPDCSPYPFDVMAVFALYQTRFSTS